MSVTPATLTALIESELSEIKDQRVLCDIRSLLVTPEPQMRPWDYGMPGEAYPCWIVLAEKSSNTGIAYCESGFGPAMPWGLLFLQGSAHMSMGMDSSWFERFLDAYFESQPSIKLPIWRVFKGDYPGTPITDEGSWEATWAYIIRLRNEQPLFKFNIGQSVYARNA
jgi:hypothetical protein